MTPVITVDPQQPLLPDPRQRAVPDELRDDITLELPSPRAVYRWAIQRGWSAEQAGNWAAYCAGLLLVDGEKLLQRPWTLREVEHLVFLRALVGVGRLDGDSEAAE